jgi:hypothetical protein
MVFRSYTFQKLSDCSDLKGRMRNINRDMSIKNCFESTFDFYVKSSMVFRSYTFQKLSDCSDLKGRMRDINKDMYIKNSFESTFDFYVKSSRKQHPLQSCLQFPAWTNNYFFRHNIFIGSRNDMLVVGDETIFIEISALRIGFKSTLNYYVIYVNK